MREAQTDRLDSSAMAERLTRHLGALTAEAQREFRELLQERREEVQSQREQVDRALTKVEDADSRAGRSLRDQRASLVWDAEHLETVFYVSRAALRESRRPPERGLER